jgi:hypothetical protein
MCATAANALFLKFFHAVRLHDSLIHWYDLRVQAGSQASSGGGMSLYVGSGFPGCNNTVMSLVNVTASGNADCRYLRLILGPVFCMLE